jgi:hypothetical protein
MAFHRSRATKRSNRIGQPAELGERKCVETTATAMYSRDHVVAISVSQWPCDTWQAQSRENAANEVESNCRRTPQVTTAKGHIKNRAE